MSIMGVSTHFYDYCDASYSTVTVSKELSRVAMVAHLKVSIVAGPFFLGAGEPIEVS